MKVKTFLEGLAGKDPHFADCMKRITDVWSNDSCRGYAIIAMKDSGMDRKQIREVLRHFDFTASLSEAERVFRTF